MTEPGETNKGKVLCRSQIKLNARQRHFSHPTSGGHRIWDERYICIFKNRQWRWENLLSLSAANFKKYQKNIIDAGNISSKYFETHELPIKIENSVGGNAGNINGCWCPIPEEKREYEFQVYRHTNSGDWLYPTTERRVVVDGSPSGGRTTFQWWIGNWSNFQKRKAWGKCRSQKKSYPGGDTIIPPPWTLKKWIIWDTEDPNKWAWREVKPAFSLSVLKNNIESINKISSLKNDCNNLTTQKMEMLGIIKELYLKSSKEERKNLMNIKLKNYFNNASVCTLCFSIDKPISKCLHFDCIGACDDCRKEAKSGGGGDGSCCACGKQQIMECPICLDTHTEQYLKILPCKHCVCWKCFCNSYELKRPLIKCPNCRKTI
jgi:hypothetical protein